jgi:hypothetical protein
VGTQGAGFLATAPEPRQPKPPRNSNSQCNSTVFLLVDNSGGRTMTRMARRSRLARARTTDRQVLRAQLRFQGASTGRVRNDSHDSDSRNSSRHSNDSTSTSTSTSTSHALTKRGRKRRLSLTYFTRSVSGSTVRAPPGRSRRHGLIRGWEVEA